MSSDVIWHIRDKLWPMPKHGSIKSTYVRCDACLAVTCHLHVWQNDRDFLRATVVTRGWNGYRNKSQHRKSTLEKKILPPFQQGFKPATFQSRVQCSNHWAIPAPFGGSCHKYCFCCNKRRVFSQQTGVCCNKGMLVTTKLLSIICRYKSFVATNIIFFTTKLLSWQAYFCHTKRCVLSWQMCFVATNVSFVMTKVFVATKL